MTLRRLVISAGLAACAPLLFAQAAVGSEEERRYDFKALLGEAERPYLNYRTLSDSDWDGEETWKLYGPELFSSYNSAAPYGMNDGALWQGRGLNSSLSAGARFAAAGFELTFKPQLTFSQNSSFKLVPSAYESEYGYIWGYGPGFGVDAPQRFGDEPFFGYSWGDSEIRYTWRNITAGFGTQSPWTGPGRINSIMHSNNAPPYPKADLGLRRTELHLFGHYLGDIEGRLWAGMLSESDYFDSISSNDRLLLSFLSAAYAPSFLPGLTLMANRSYLAPWEYGSVGAVTSLFFVNLSGGGSQDTWDQRASLGANYLLPQAGIEVYGELGLNDYGPTRDGYIRYPFHSMVYTAGLRKGVDVPVLKGARGELLFEWTNLELSQDFQFQGPATFYMHHQAIQGYTNRGQWLAAGIGTGGNSQYLGFSVYADRWSSNFFVLRVNPDNDYLYRHTIGDQPYDQYKDRIKDFRADLTFGMEYSLAVTPMLSTTFALALTQIHNRLYDSPSFGRTEKEYNFRGSVLVRVSVPESGARAEK